MISKKRIGDIYLNPMFGDLWILRRELNDKEKMVWVLSLVNEDLVEEFKYVKGFKKIGNIYDMCEEKLNDMGWFKNE